MAFDLNLDPVALGAHWAFDAVSISIPGEVGQEVWLLTDVQLLMSGTQTHFMNGRAEMDRRTAELHLTFGSLAQGPKPVMTFRRHDRWLYFAGQAWQITDQRRIFGSGWTLSLRTAPHLDGAVNSTPAAPWIG